MAAKEVIMNDVTGKKYVVNVEIPSKDSNNKITVSTDDVILCPVTTTSVATTLTKAVPMHGLNAISLFAGQSITKDHAQFTYTRSIQSTRSILKPLHPPPLISYQFQSMTKKQQQNGQSLLRKAVENDTDNTTVSLVLAAPSGVNSSTVTHVNRSLVYRKPVTTKDTAPTKNGNELNIIDLTENNSKYKTNHSPDADDKANAVVKSKESSISENSLLAAIVEPKTKNCNELVRGAEFQLSLPTKQQLEQQYKILSTNTGNQQYPYVKKLLQEYSEWESHSGTAKNLLPVEKSLKMNEIFAKCHVQKRNRAKSTYHVDAQLDESGVPLKMNRTKSNESLEIINLDELPEKTEPRVYRAATQSDYLFNMIRSDARKVLEQRVKTVSIAGGSKIQISNGQLSDANGPIRLLDKSTKQISAPDALHIARIQSQNAAIASLPAKDKARKLKESIESTETVLNWIENGDEKHVKRTYSRSKSLSTKSKMHFKINNMANPSKVRRVKVRSINHVQDWEDFANVLSSNVQKSDIKKNIPVDSHSSGKNTPSEQMSNGNSRATSPSEIEQVLSWNTNRTLAQLPKSQVIFQRNEFGLIEMDGLAMTKIKALKSHKSDYKKFPQFEPSMACGHPDFAGCFDAIIQRLNSGNPTISCKVNDKKPHQYFSTEFKEIIGALVQKKNNNCQAITSHDILEALLETNMYERTKNSSHFSWSRFIDYYNKKCTTEEQIQLAPIDLFVNAMPKTPNTFEIGQKLEAIDPQNSSLFCVCTIVDKCGYRIKLRFDGYPATYDFWVNADSMNIFPAGWCSKTGRELEVNRRFTSNRNTNFEWKEYLRQTNTQAAHKACFPNLNTARTQMNPFKIGLKFEAEDTRNTNRLCVATIGDVIDSRILVTLDGLDSCYNYWTDIRSPYIHPINFHQENGYSIESPPNWRMAPFSWENYLRINRAESVPKDAFHMRKPKPFTIGMALEVVDKKNPSLIRPAVVTNIDEYQIKVLFIGWPEKYSYWIDDDSCDIFPPGYCKKTGHPIECPLDFIYELPKNTCGTPGCRGIGNGKRPESNTHSTLEECPYEKNNWSADESTLRPSRVDRKHKAINSAFNIGAGPSRKVSVNPAFEKVQVSLQKTLNPAELAAMSSKDVEIFRRLQVSAQFLLENHKALSELRDQWIDRLKPLRPVQVLAAAKNPLNWSKEEVAAFVSQLPNCSMLASTFLENEIDGLAFLSLRQSDMIDIMGLTMGSAIKVFNRIVLLREECNTHYIRYE